MNRKRTVLVLWILTMIVAFTGCQIKFGDKQETTAPTAAQTIAATTVTEAETEPPTEPPYVSAYRAYIRTLEENESAIRDYTWQLSGGETKPVVFADVMGDETPELIYAYATEVVNRGSNGNRDQGRVGFRVVTCVDGEARQAYENTSLSQNVAQVDAPYMLFQTVDSRDLYTYFDTSKTFKGFRIVRLVDDGAGSLREETAAEYSDIEPSPDQSKFMIEGEASTLEETKQYGHDLLANNPSALMISVVGGFLNDYEENRLDFFNIDAAAKENQAMTYDEALTYLNENTQG